MGRNNIDWIPNSDSETYAGVEIDEIKSDRWHMSRAGLVNFWYYGNQEFELEEGRLILRGANGSGKSVTMQSFLPLILDGDKRPHRIDPFGSRDRRIDYYLLLDSDTGFAERTGYLWMEFANPVTGCFKTIGIGLRAKRGAAQVAFWGFVLDSGRRINKDFFLFNEQELHENGNVLPLTRKQLEEQIGMGGEVVQDQTSYRDMVNKALFRFPDVDAYQDLLQLLIQLRSPKLSKDFKPTAIYEILQDALPPLLEDELSPLSEVLEDMDEIGDRLEELQIHLREIRRLTDDYRTYNEFMLFRRSQQLLQSKGKLDKHQAQTDNLNADRDLQGELVKEIEQRMEQARVRIQVLRAELDVLDNHEALSVERELEIAERHLRETTQHLEASHRRLIQQQERLKRQEQTADQDKENLDQLERSQRVLLEDLESAARELEFPEHDVYSLQWDRDIPDQDSWREPWRRDLNAHRHKLEEALDLAREEREARQLTNELERQVGEARRERDEVEHNWKQAEQGADLERERLKEAYITWSRRLKKLPLHSQRVSAMLQSITELDERQPSYEKMREPAFEAFSERQTELLARQAELRQQLEQETEIANSTEREKWDWENSREPEPLRTAARKETRQKRQSGLGAPLYEVCDFKNIINDEERALLEEQLERTGILDAWIVPEGQLVLTRGEEDSWLTPLPHQFGYTLADMLEPVPFESSGLTNSVIENVLRSFLWGEFGPADEPVIAMLSPSGGYWLGPLAGSVAIKKRAEYIGKETRRRTRDLMIQQLQDQLATCMLRIEILEKELADTVRDLSELRQELEQLPTHEILRAAFDKLAECRHTLEASVRQEQRLLERLSGQKSALQDAQERLAVKTSGWSRLKRENDLAEALKNCGSYAGNLSELHTTWRSWREAEGIRLRSVLEANETRELIEQEEQTEAEHEETGRRLRAQITKLLKLIADLGLDDIYAQISQVKKEQEDLLRQLEKDEQERRDCYDRYSELKAGLEQARAELIEAAEQWRKAASDWRVELDLGFLAEWKEVFAGEAEEEKSWVRLSREIEKTYRASYENKDRDQISDKLHATFNEVRHTLSEYVLSLDRPAQAGGRQVIVSMRDRFNPQQLFLVAEEIISHEAEQRLMLTEKDRQLYEEIILRSVGKSIRQKIIRAMQWVEQMQRLMSERNTSSGLRLSLEWEPRPATNEEQMDTAKLVQLLMREVHRLDDEDMESIVRHFRDHINQAKSDALEQKDSLRKHLQKLLDYREWFEFRLYYRKGGQSSYKELTDARFNVLSGGEKAMAMYIPLLAAAYSRYSDAAPEAPRLISLDEAFAGVDEENMKDMFQLLTDMGFDYMMTSQVLWGCYSTVPRLAIYEIHRPKDADYVAAFHYRWDGKDLKIGEEELQAAVELASPKEESGEGYERIVESEKVRQP